MKEREQLEQTIAAIEAQRAILGDGVVEATLNTLRDRLARLDQPSGKVLDKPGRIDAPEAISQSSQRRTVTILFCDVKGSTAMAEQIDPEEWAGIIQRALEYMTAPVLRHGGTVADFRGDGIMAFFGAPAAHEDDPQRAINAGLEILEGIRVFSEQIQQERHLDFAVRVGIHTGLVVVGGVGTGEQVGYTAIGDTVNLAARMEQTAQPGTVQISEQTYTFAEQEFICQSLGEIKVKGKRKPIRTYRVISRKAEPGPLRGLERQGLHSPMVGRAAELAALQNSLDGLLTGQGGIVSILGEAGIGKSRLVEEIRREIHSYDLLWLEGHTLSYGQRIPFWPFQEILRSYAGITDQDGEDQTWEKLVHKIKELFPGDTEGKTPTITEILPYLASLLALPVRGDYLERVKYLDGEALGKQIFLATRRFFERLAASRPVVLVFEDLHWMDESSAALLEHLLPLVKNLPLLIICPGRPDRQTTATHLSEAISKAHISHYIPIRLTSLSQDNSTQLVHNLLDIEDLPERVRTMIVVKADGNPFFLEEILRTMIALGAIRRDQASGRWRATETIEHISIPETLQGIILARLDRLEQAVNYVLRVAAVIGRSFLYRVLRAVEKGGRLDDHLAELVASELILEKQHFPELEYLFKHVLVQEATYESILLQTRRDLHRRIGEAIETLFADRLEEFYGLLAHHFARAEAWVQAQAYLLKAADQAGRMAADAEALAHYQQAKEAYARAFGERWDPVERAALERKMGEALFRRGEHTRSREYFRQALDSLGRPLPKAGLAMRMAILWEISLHIFHRLLPGLFPVHDPGPLEAEEFRIYQAIFLTPDINEFTLLNHFRMMNFCEQYGFYAGVAMVYATLGIVLNTFLNLPQLAEYYLHQATRLAEMLKMPDALGLAYAGQALLAISHLDLDRALELVRKAAGTLWETGDLQAWAVPTNMSCTYLVWRGDFSRAMVYGQELAQTGRDSAIRLLFGAGLAKQGIAEQRLGRLEEAITHLEQAIEIAEAVPDALSRTEAGNELGRCFLLQGNWQAALEVLEANHRFMVEHNMGRNPLRIAGYWIHVTGSYLLAAEEGDRTGRTVWLKKAKDSCRMALKWGKVYRYVKSEAMRLQGRYEWLNGNKAQAQYWWNKSLAEAEYLGMPYELGQTHLEIGERLSDEAHLEQAEAIFDEIGAGFDLHRARDSLARFHLPRVNKEKSE